MPTAIFTKYRPYTNTRSSRIKAYTAVDGNVKGRSVTVEYDHALSAEENHKRAALALAEKLAWHGTWYVGHGDDVYIFVRYMCSQDAAFAVAYDADKERAALAKLGVV